MKKILSIAMLFAAAATAFVSCTKEDTIATDKRPALSGATKTITVTSASTRTAITEDYTLEWSEGDTYGILFADADGKIIGYTESPEYSAETETYTLDVPEETAALYCFYPYDAVSQSELESAVSAGATGVKYGINNLNIYDGVLTGDLYTYMAANAAIEDDTATVAFQLLASILELSIYDSTGEDQSALQSIRIYADKAAGYAELSFADGGIELLTAESEELDIFIGASFNTNGQILDDDGKVLQEPVYVNVGTESEPAKIYLPILKGEYKSFQIYVATDEHYFGSSDNRLVIDKGEINIEKNIYKVSVDLAEGETPGAGGDSETGIGHEFGNATVNKDAGVGDMNAVINHFKSINNGDEGWSNNQSWWSTEWQYSLDVTGNGGLVTVSFDAWPTNDIQAFSDEYGAQTTGKVGFQGGSLLLYSYGKSWVVFYEGEYPIAYIYVNYHSENGDEDTDDAVFAISSNGAKITKATGTEDWAVAVGSHLVGGGYGDFINSYWELEYTADANDVVTFSEIPELGSASDHRFYFYTNSKWGYNSEATGLFTYTGTPTTVNLHGTNSSDTEEYVVALSGTTSKWGDPEYIVHVVYKDSLDDDDDDNQGGGQGGEEGDGTVGSGAFALAANTNNATLKLASDEDDWVTFIKGFSYGMFADDVKEYLELTVTGDANVTFSACPEWAYSGELDLKFYTQSGSTWVPDAWNDGNNWIGTWDSGDVTVSIVDSSADSADYIVIFSTLDTQKYGVPTYAVHVVYSKN